MKVLVLLLAVALVHSTIAISLSAPGRRANPHPQRTHASVLKSPKLVQAHQEEDEALSNATNSSDDNARRINDQEQKIKELEQNYERTQAKLERYEEQQTMNTAGAGAVDSTGKTEFIKGYEGGFKVGYEAGWNMATADLKKRYGFPENQNNTNNNDVANALPLGNNSRTSPVVGGSRNQDQQEAQALGDAAVGGQQPQEQPEEEKAIEDSPSRKMAQFFSNMKNPENNNNNNNANPFATPQAQQVQFPDFSQLIPNNQQQQQQQQAPQMIQQPAQLQPGQLQPQQQQPQQILQQPQQPQQQQQQPAFNLANFLNQAMNNNNQQMQGFNPQQQQQQAPGLDMTQQMPGQMQQQQQPMSLGNMFAPQQQQQQQQQQQPFSLANLFSPQQQNGGGAFGLPQKAMSFLSNIKGFIQEGQSTVNAVRDAIRPPMQQQQQPFMNFQQQQQQPFPLQPQQLIQTDATTENSNSNSDQTLGLENLAQLLATTTTGNTAAPKPVAAVNGADSAALGMQEMQNMIQEGRQN